MTKTYLKEKSIWEGVYQNFSEVPISSPVFNDDLWVTKQHARIKQIIENHQNGTIVSRDYPMPVITSMLLQQKKHVSVLDFGGGMGQTYFEIICKVPDARERITFTVVETLAVTQNLAPEVKGYPHLNFTDNYKTISMPIDLIHVGSTLQYIDDWHGLLMSLAKKFKPSIFVLSDLLVGDIPTFVTAQSYYDRIICARFINEREFCEHWDMLGYDLIFRSDYQPIEGDDYFSNHALPETHRLRKPCHMVFMPRNISQ